jgi:hypothetical protein
MSFALVQHALAFLNCRRYATAYSTPNLDEAKRTVEVMWESLWNALKKAKRQALLAPRPAA